MLDIHGDPRATIARSGVAFEKAAGLRVEQIERFADPDRDQIKADRIGQFKRVGEKGFKGFPGFFTTVHSTILKAEYARLKPCINFGMIIAVFWRSGQNKGFNDYSSLRGLLVDGDRLHTAPTHCEIRRKAAVIYRQNLPFRPIWMQPRGGACEPKKLP